jgi:hypothetical protein
MIPCVDGGAFCTREPSSFKMAACKLLAESASKALRNVLCDRRNRIENRILIVTLCS